MDMETTYRIGIILSSAGVSAQQRSWIHSRLEWMLQVRPKMPVLITVAGFRSSDTGERYGLRQQNFPQKEGVRAGLAFEYVPTRDTDLQQQVEACLACFNGFDEIWCMPGAGQTSYLHKSRPMLAYRTKWASIPWARLKLIPPWVESQSPPKRKKSKPATRKRAPLWT